MDFTPINPMRTKSGALAALVSHLGEDSAKPTRLADREAAFRNFRVISDSLSLSAAASLGVGSIFSGSGSMSDQGFYFDAMTYTDQYEEQTVPHLGIYATRWGVGIRILLRVQALDASLSLNFGTVGAAVELKKAHARYEIVGIGIGIDGLTIVLDELPAIGDFKYETYLKLNGPIVKKLAQHIKDNKASLVPEPVAVALARPIDPLSSGRATYFAMRCIADRMALKDALYKAQGRDLSEDTIRGVYVQVARTEDDAQQPSGEVQAKAKAWLSY